MNRLGESESTPKKRNLKQEETVVREAITKSGRKVKRPAHLDLPEQAPSASPSEARKSVAVRGKKALEPSAVTPSKRTVSKEQNSPEEVKGTGKTIAASRKTTSEHLDTPKKNKETKQTSDAVNDAAGISKSGRKIKIPAKLMEFESDVLNSPRKNVASDQSSGGNEKLAKTPARSKIAAKLSVDQHPDEEEEKNAAVRKTPGRRAKSIAPDQLEANSVRTPKRRGVSSLFNKEAPQEKASMEPAHSKTPGKRVATTLQGVDAKASPKTPGRRVKSAAPGKESTDETQLVQNVSETSSKAPKNTTQTGGRRVGSKSMVVQTSGNESSDTVQAVPKTPGRRGAKSIVDASRVTTLSVESPRAQRTSQKATTRRVKSVAIDNSDSIEETKTDGRKLVDNEHLHIETESIVETKHASTVDKNTTAEEPLSRSGRKIKPKKVFAFEDDGKPSEHYSTNEKVSIDSNRKRKVDTADESMKSPTKKKMIENVGSKTPKRKSPEPESNPSVLVDAEASRLENPSDVSISRSGRKIKPKKMFGFIDGDNNTTTNFVHVTGCTPTLDEKTDEVNSTESNMSAMDAVPKDARSTKMKTALDHNVEELVEDVATDQQQTFITMRGVNDHHKPRALDKQQHFIDETDRAMVSSDPIIIRTSIGFGKPTARKQTPSEGTGKSVVDDCRKLTPPHTVSQAVGSSRSGRKIKPKKFFDTDDQPTVSHQPVLTTKALPTVLSPKQQIVGKQENETLSITAPVDNVAAEKVTNSEEGIDIPEGPVKLVDEATVENPGSDVEKEQYPEQEKVEEPDHSELVKIPEGDLHDMKEEEKVEMIDEKSCPPKEEVAAQLVEENSDLPEKQNMSPEADNLENRHLSDGSVATSLHHIEQATLNESSLNSTDIKINPQAENVSAKNTDLAHALAIDEIANKSNVSTECLHENSTAAVAEGKLTMESTEIPTGGIISLGGMSDEKMLEDASFGSMEYLEDEMNNIVEHIKKPSVPQKQSEEDGKSVSTSAIPSIVLIPETPAPNALNETFSPAKPNSGSIIDITADTPGPVAPRTPDSKLAGSKTNDKCSPDKPPEIIEIMDSPAEAAFCKRIIEESAYGAGEGSASSTPLTVRPLAEETLHECVDDEPLSVQFESRKRSLSTSAVDMTIKRNVTFHSPANCTMLVETIDERLMLKSLQDQQQQREEMLETSSKSIGEKLRKPRKRSLSEHNRSELKRNKISKLPNFKSIHAKHFDRMESVAEFLKRKETRAKQIHSACSPATKLLAQPVSVASGTSGVASVEKKIPSSSTKPFIFKSAGGGIPVPSAGLFVKRTKEVGPTAAMAATSIAKNPIASDRDRMANRLKQFHATFKPKQIGTSAVPASGSLSSTTTSEVGLLRSKQSKILKGVRTNRRFELQMKHRDNLQHQ